MALDDDVALPLADEDVLADELTLFEAELLAEELLDCVALTEVDGVDVIEHMASSSSARSCTSSCSASPRSFSALMSRCS